MTIHWFGDQKLVRAMLQKLGRVCEKYVPPSRHICFGEYLCARCNQQEDLHDA